MVSYHLLLIDDDVLLPRLIRPRLRQLPGEFVLHSAQDGIRGLEMAAALRPDLILLDWRMPGLDGFETLSRLRANTDTARIPVVTISGAIPTRGRCAEMIVRTEAYLAKPLDFGQLTGVLEQFLCLSLVAGLDARGMA